MRRLTLADAEELRTLAVATYLSAYRESLSAEELASRISVQHHPEEFRRRLADPEHRIFGLPEGDRLRGYFQLNLRSQSESCPLPGYAEIVRLYVHAESKGRRLGSALIREAERVSQQEDRRGLWLHCYDQNIEGILFYQRMGYRILGRDPFEIQPGRRRYDLVFAKALPV